MARQTFTTKLRLIMPPWLQRTVGAKLLTAIGEQIEALLVRTALSVKLRFPGHDEANVDEEALAYIGRDRKIRRGPSEDAVTYARRLRLWFQTHRTRGGAYALLRQLHAYTLDWLNVRMDVVAKSGRRRWIDEDGVITADTITWDTDPDQGWAHVWLFFYLPDEIPLGFDYIVTHDGDRWVTHDGDFWVASRTISPSEMSDDEKAIFTAVAREWSAAHIPYITVVLLYGVGELWDYPAPMGTWDEWVDPTKTVDEDAPVILIAE